MKKHILLLLIPILTISLMGEKWMTLSEISKPEMLEIGKEKLYIMEGSTVFMYDLKTQKLKKQFCKKGEGPGELKLNPGIPNYLIATESSVLAVSMDKAIEYSLDGELKREFKIPNFTNYLYPTGANFIGMKFEFGKDRKADLKVVIFDKELKIKKELYSQKLSGGQNLIDLTSDGVNMAVSKETLYIEESAKGFEISKFDMNGNETGRIKKKVPAVKFTDKHKNEALENIKNNSMIKQMGWENFKNVVKIIHQDYLPPIQDLAVDGDTLYLRTNRSENGKVEFIVMTPQGKELKRIMLPKPMEANFVSKMFGRPAKFYKIYQGFYYYIIENEEDEEWEIHRIKI